MKFELTITTCIVWMAFCAPSPYRRDPTRLEFLCLCVCAILVLSSVCVCMFGYECVYESEFNFPRVFLCMPSSLLRLVS